MRRVCYGRETGNDEATIKRLINDEHWSMFRHGTYYMIANDSDKTLETIIINNAKIIASMIRNNLMELGYDFRDL